MDCERKELNKLAKQIYGELSKSINQTIQNAFRARRWFELQRVELARVTLRV